MANEIEIVSVQNPRVKLWSQLLQKKGRIMQGQFLIEGVHLVQEALQSGAGVKTVAYSIERGLPADFIKEQYDSVEWVGVSEAVLKKCSDVLTPQSVFAVADIPVSNAEKFLSFTDSLVVVVDGVQDPGNLGTIVRTADAVGADGVLLGKGTADLYNPKTVRSTMGSLFHLPIAECELPSLLALARERGVQLINSSLQAKRTCYEVDFTGSTWIVVGNEGQGVSGEAAKLVDQHVIIPMRGQSESLNVAMATTILLYEALRQRHYK